jgi:hypothetical protein
LSLQGAEENIITITGKFKAFEKKAAILDKKSKDLKFDLLPSINVSTIKTKYHEKSLSKIYSHRSPNTFRL